MIVGAGIAMPALIESTVSVTTRHIESAPTDLVAYQQAIAEARPDWIIEVGTRDPEGLAAAIRSRQACSQVSFEKIQTRRNVARSLALVADAHDTADEFPAVDL